MTSPEFVWKDDGSTPITPENLNKALREARRALAVAQQALAASGGATSKGPDYVRNAGWYNIAPLGEQSNVLVTLGRLYLTPVFAAAGAWDRLGAQITTAGAAGTTIRVGIYGNQTGTNRSRPNSLLVDTGTAVADATGFREFTASVTVPGNALLWLGVVAQGTGTAPRLKSTVADGSVVSNGAYVPPNATGNLGLNNTHFYTDGVTGALPSSLSAVSIGLEDVPRISFRWV